MAHNYSCDMHNLCVLVSLDHIQYEIGQGGTPDYKQLYMVIDL